MTTTVEFDERTAAWLAEHGLDVDDVRSVVSLPDGTVKVEKVRRARTGHILHDRYSPLIDEVILPGRSS